MRNLGKVSCAELAYSKRSITASIHLHGPPLSMLVAPHQPPRGSAWSLLRGRGAATLPGQVPPGEATPGLGTPPSRAAPTAAAMTAGAVCRPRGHTAQGHGPDRGPGQNLCTLPPTPVLCDPVTQRGVSRPAAATPRPELQVPPQPRPPGP